MTNLVSRLGRAVACVALAACAVGCATVTRGTHETWKVVTSPPDASVETSNGFSCHQTPCTFKVERKAEFDVTVSRDGYKTYRGRVVHKEAGGGVAGMAGNVLIGGLIGAGVDAANGSMMDLSPNPMIVDLEKADPAPPTPGPGQPPAS
jgi:hypothetical protein